MPFIGSLLVSAGQQQGELQAAQGRGPVTGHAVEPLSYAVVDQGDCAGAGAVVAIHAHASRRLVSGLGDQSAVLVQRAGGHGVDHEVVHVHFGQAVVPISEQALIL